MAAAMCLTVGGVYATWNYAESNNIDNPQAFVLSVGVTHANQAGAMISVSTNSNLKVWIDGKTASVGGEEVNNVAYIDTDHEDLSRNETSGALTVKIDTHASNEIARKLNVNLKVEVTQHVIFDSGNGEEHVFAFTNTGSNNYTPGDAFATYDYQLDIPAGESSFVQTFTCQQLIELIGLGLNGDIVLETYSEYSAFVEKIISTAKLNVKVTVTDITPTPINN